MLPDFATKRLMDYVDIFCEKNYFTANDTEQLIKEAKKYKLLEVFKRNSIFYMNGYGLYVWSAFIFTIFSFASLYMVTKIQHLKEKNKFFKN